MTYSVLDTHTREASIIGFAKTAEEASHIAIADYSEFCSAEEIADMKGSGHFTYTFRSFVEQEYDDIDPSELSGGFWDNA